MSRNCERAFDEELISGYIDGALPQMQAQSVRLHVEDCGACRNLLEELETLRETARSTRFTAPADEEWSELAALAERAPHVVTIDELMEVVWPDVVVADETVSQRVRLVREALGP